VCKQLAQGYTRQHSDVDYYICKSKRLETQIAHLRYTSWGVLAVRRRWREWEQ